MWARKFRRDVSYTLRDLDRDVAKKGLKLDTPRMDGRVRGSRRLVAVEPVKNRVVAQFEKDMSRYEHDAKTKRRSLFAALAAGRSG